MLKIFPILEEISVYHLVVNASHGYAKVERALRASPEIQNVEPNYKVQLNAVESKAQWGANDQFLFYQWGVNNIGQSAPWGLPGKYGADMKVIETWKKFPLPEVSGDTYDKNTTIVAVLDTGIWAKHEDLNANMWVNKKEAAEYGGIAGRDDDGNGYPDDVNGYDFNHRDVKLNHGKNLGSSDPTDDHGHGTHCAGVIAAVRNNDVGIAGVNPRAKIMSVKVLNGNGGGTLDDILDGLVYAYKNGADIASASLGVPANYDPNRLEIFGKVIDYVTTTNSKRGGMLFVVAAGNDGKNIDIKSQATYPAAYSSPGILTVGASDNQDNAANFSNYGHENVDVFAPGVGVLSTVLKNGYSIMSGTSMATPYVAGIASYLMSYYPELKGQPEKVKQIILATADKVPSMYGKSISNGRINALKALENANSFEQSNPIQWTQVAHSYAQKEHNVELVDIRHEIKQDNAKALRIHFNFINIDKRFDALYIYDKDLTLVSKIERDFVGYDGLSGVELSGYWSPVIKGDKAYVRFVNSKVKKTKVMPGVQMKASETNNCLREGGEWRVATLPDGSPDAENIQCIKDSMDIAYGDLKKDTDDPNVFFSHESKGFEIDMIEYTENEI